MHIYIRSHLWRPSKEGWFWLQNSHKLSRPHEYSKDFLCPRSSRGISHFLLSLIIVAFFFSSPGLRYPHGFRSYFLK